MTIGDGREWIRMAFAANRAADENIPPCLGFFYCQARQHARHFRRPGAPSARVPFAAVSDGHDLDLGRRPGDLRLELFVKTRSRSANNSPT
jgi:hypothetical protein